MFFALIKGLKIGIQPAIKPAWIKGFLAASASILFLAFRNRVLELFTLAGSAQIELEFHVNVSHE